MKRKSLNFINIISGVWGMLKFTGNNISVNKKLIPYNKAKVLDAYHIAVTDSYGNISDNTLQATHSSYSPILIRPKVFFSIYHKNKYIMLDNLMIFQYLNINDNTLIAYNLFSYLALTLYNKLFLENGVLSASKT